MKFIVKKLGLQKLKTYESTFFPDRKTPAAIKIQNLEAAVFYSIFSHRQFNRSYTAILLALLAIAVEAVIILLFNTKGKIFLMIYFCSEVGNQNAYWPQGKIRKNSNDNFWEKTRSPQSRSSKSPFLQYVLHMEILWRKIESKLFFPQRKKAQCFFFLIFFIWGRQNYYFFSSISIKKI